MLWEGHPYQPGALTRPGSSAHHLPLSQTCEPLFSRWGARVTRSFSPCLQTLVVFGWDPPYNKTQSPNGAFEKHLDFKTKKHRN